MQDDELPKWMLDDTIKDEEKLTELYGRGMRERKDVCYDDDLTEHQWTKV
jgi:hypothetical protein